MKTRIFSILYSAGTTVLMLFPARDATPSRRVLAVTSDTLHRWIQKAFNN